MATDLTNSDNAVTVVSRINTAIYEQNKGVSQLGADPNASTVISRVHDAIDAEGNNQLYDVSNSDNAVDFIRKVNDLFASIRNGGGGDTPTPTYHDAPSILIIGNSFTLDSWTYVPFILKAVGINIKIGMCYTASTGLGGQYGNYNYGPSFTYNSTTGTYVDATNRGFFYIDTSKDNAWSQKIAKGTFNKGEQRIDANQDDYRVPTPRQCVVYYEGMENELQNAQKALEDESNEFTYSNIDKLGKLWDVIVLQQVSTQSVTLSTYVASDGKIYSLKLKELIDNDIANDYVLGWNINHSRRDYDAPTDILANIKDCYDEGENDQTTIAAKIDVVFPYGTAIFYARNNPTLKQIGYDSYTDLWVDGQHLAGGLPHFLASLTIVEKIFRKYYPNEGLSVTNNAAIANIIPNSNWVNSHGNMPSPRAKSPYIVGATAENCAIARQIAEDACDDPWDDNGNLSLKITISCTNCYIDSAPSEYGIEQGSKNATFFVGKGEAIIDIVIKTEQNYSLTKNGSAHNWRYTRLGVGTATSLTTSSNQCNVSLGSEQVTNNITMLFRAF